VRLLPCVIACNCVDRRFTCRYCSFRSSTKSPRQASAPDSTATSLPTPTRATLILTEQALSDLR
jgi:hypothetical protein